MYFIFSYSFFMVLLFHKVISKCLVFCWQSDFECLIRWCFTSYQCVLVQNKSRQSWTESNKYKSNEHERSTRMNGSMNFTCRLILHVRIQVHQLAQRNQVRRLLEHWKRQQQHLDKYSWNNAYELLISHILILIVVRFVSNVS